MSYFAELRAAVDEAQETLMQAVLAACPKHKPVQHRDRKPRWCRTCGRDWRGVNWRDEAPAQPDDQEAGE